MMNNNFIRKAAIEDIPQLKNIWETCFDDVPSAIDIFFRQSFTFTDCYVYNNNNIPVAMLFIIPSNIIYKNICNSCGYFYACATLPQYRSNGIMQELIKYAIADCRDKYDYFSLVPANENLFNYYKKLGFNKYFYINIASVNIKDIINTNQDNISFFIPDARQLNHIRKDYFNNNFCYVDWNLPHINNVIMSSQIYGAKILGIKCSNKYGYAIFNKENDKIFINELICHTDIFASLIKKISETYNTQEFIIRTHCNYNPLKGYSNEKPYGMLYGELPISSDIKPYLGLAMD